MSAFIPHDLAYPKSFCSYAQTDNVAGEPKCVLNNEGKSLVQRIVNQKLQEEKNSIKNLLTQTSPYFNAKDYQNIRLKHEKGDEIRDFSPCENTDAYQIRKDELTRQTSEKVLKLAERDLIKEQKREEANKDLINRVSHIARVPICLLGAILHATKTIVKAAIWIFIPVDILTDKSRFGLKGVKEEAALTIGALFRTVACFNPKDNDSFLLGCSKIGKNLLWEITDPGEFVSTPFLAHVNAYREKFFNNPNSKDFVAKLISDRSDNILS